MEFIRFAVKEFIRIKHLFLDPSNPASLMSEDILDNEHILATILLKLTVESLFRIRRVSKSWRDLIDSSYFKEMHCSFIQLLPSSESKIITNVGHKIYAFDSIVENGREGYTAIVKRLRTPEPLSKKNDFQLRGSCNGTILFSCSDDFILWNPFTGTTLNCCEESTSPTFDSTRENFCPPHLRLRYALGYDHFNDDYKLVRWQLCNCVRKGKDLYEVCVYSFKHKSWTTITDAAKLDIKTSDGHLPYCCTFTNGKMHWPLVEIGMILAFDLGTYEFKKMPCAPIPTKRMVMEVMAMELSFSCLNGCLCLSYTFNVSTDLTVFRNADIWVMKEYGIESSWTKIACIDSRDNPDLKFYEMNAVVYSEKTGMLLLQRLTKYLEIIRLVVYDLKTKSLRDVRVTMKEKIRLPVFVLEAL